MREDSTRRGITDSIEYLDRLRWLARIMNDTDTALPFVCDLLSYRLRRGYLTQNQAVAVNDIAYRVSFALIAGELDCLPRKSEPEPEPEQDPLNSTAWEWWIDVLDVSIREANVLRAIALHMEADGVAAVSQSQLSRVSDVSLTEVWKCVTRLEQRGILSVERSRKKGSKQPNRYCFGATEGAGR
jgi:biotin operon repressor